jgi:sugar-specific transcriptional regulator TrmB
LSLERIIKTLESFGLKQIEAEVYVYLGKKGPQEVKDLAEALKIRKRKLYSILKNLQAKGIVTANQTHATVYSALNFEKTLDLLEKENIQKTKAIRKTLENFKSN